MSASEKGKGIQEGTTEIAMDSSELMIGAEESWDVHVLSGRCLQIDPGDGNGIRITRIKIDSPLYPQGHACEVYLGEVQDEVESVMGTLSSETMSLDTNKLLEKPFVLGHNGHGISVTFSFSGKKSVSSCLSLPLPPSPEPSLRFPVAFTSEILSMLDTTTIARLECLSKDVYTASCLHTHSYSDIDLTLSPTAEDLEALTVLQRSHQPRSLTLGCLFSYKRDQPTIFNPIIFKPNIFFTGRCLLPLRHNGTRLKKLKLHYLLLLTQTDLLPVFQGCTELTDFEMNVIVGESTGKGGVTIYQLLALVSEYSKKLEHLSYSDLRYYKTNKIKDATLETFIHSCTKISHLTLGQVNLTNDQVVKLIHKLKCLEHLNLEGSVGYIPNFLSDLKGGDTTLKVLVLDFTHLSKDVFCQFFGCLVSDFQSLEKIQISITLQKGPQGQKYKEVREKIEDLKISRPGLEVTLSVLDLSDDWTFRCKFSNHVAAMYGKFQRSLAKGEITDMIGRHGCSSNRKQFFDWEAHKY